MGRIQHLDLPFDLRQEGGISVPDQLREPHHLKGLPTGRGPINPSNQPFRIANENPSTGRKNMIWGHEREGAGSVGTCARCCCTGGWGASGCPGAWPSNPSMSSGDKVHGGTTGGEGDPLWLSVAPVSERGADAAADMGAIDGIPCAVSRKVFKGYRKQPFRLGPGYRANCLRHSPSVTSLTSSSPGLTSLPTPRPPNQQ